jgi:mono/diheme cytochrome c family protein
MLAAIAGAALVLTFAALSDAQNAPRQDYTSGEFLYRSFCASCHGPTGKGDGPVADLGPRPSDLTRLTATHGGVFPRALVRTALEGTRRVDGQLSGAMPNWHDVLKKTEGADERTISTRIDALVTHVESLQR